MNEPKERTTPMATKAPLVYNDPTKPYPEIPYVDICCMPGCWSKILIGGESAERCSLCGCRLADDPELAEAEEI